MHYDNGASVLQPFNLNDLTATLHFGTSAGRARITELSEQGVSILFGAAPEVVTQGSRVAGVIVAGADEARFMGIVQSSWAEQDGAWRAAIVFTKKATETANKLMELHLVGSTPTA